MSDELDRLKQAMTAEGQPLPDEMRRRADILRAMDAFEEEFVGETQGSPETSRPTNTGNTVFNSLWRRLMTPISENLKPLLLAGVSVGVLSIAVLNTQHIFDDPNLAEKTSVTANVPAEVAQTKAESAPVQTAEGKTDQPREARFAEKKAEQVSRDLAASLSDTDGNRVAQPKNSERGKVVGELMVTGDDVVDRKENDVVARTPLPNDPEPRVQYEAEQQQVLGDERSNVGNKVKGKSQVDGLTKADDTAVILNFAAPATPKSNEVVTGGSLQRGAGGYANGAASAANESAAVEQFAASGKLAKNRQAGSQSRLAMRELNSQLSGSRLRRVDNTYRQKQIIAKDRVQPTYQDEGRDKFEETAPNPVKLVQEQPVSTFSVDVDTASYGFVRAQLNRGVLPPREAVRIEEMINYFSYDYPAPDSREEPFSSHVSVMPAPWSDHTKLVHIGIKGYELPDDVKPKSNLVFLIDTSGSMRAANKLPLLVQSFKMLLSTLHPDDTVSIVTYAGHAGTALRPTKVRNIHRIHRALDRLQSRGSTAGAAGIQQAYQLAEENYDDDSVNRVILATDGDFNVGITNREALKRYISRKRRTGISLSVLGFGMGNYNDALMQTLAQNGNGNAAYIDSLSEARKVLVEEAGSTLFTIAKDVKIQIEFNPANGLGVPI